MKRKLISAVLTLVMVLSVIAFVPAKEAKAATTYSFRYATYNIYYDTLDSRGTSCVNISGGYSLSAAAIKNLKCSNSSVYVYARKGGKITFNAPCKKFSFTISCSVGGQTIKTKVNMIPAGNPFKTFNIGTRKLAAAFKTKTSLYTINPIAKEAGNTVITMNTGWKLTGFSYYNYKGGAKEASNLNLSKDTLKLGKLAYDGTSNFLRIYVKHTKSGMTRTYEFEYVD